MSRLILRRQLKPPQPPAAEPKKHAPQRKTSSFLQNRLCIEIRRRCWYDCQFCEVYDGALFLVNINGKMVRFRKIGTLAVREDTTMPLRGLEQVFARFGDFDA
jgi:hypothetical protein